MPRVSTNLPPQFVKVNSAHKLPIYLSSVPNCTYLPRSGPPNCPDPARTICERTRRPSRACEASGRSSDFRPSKYFSATTSRTCPGLIGTGKTTTAYARQAYGNGEPSSPTAPLAAPAPETGTTGTRARQPQSKTLI